MHVIELFFCSPNISEQLGKVHFPRFVQAAAPKYIGLFLFLFCMNKNLNAVMCYITVWLFIAFCLVKLGQAWGVLPIK